MGDERCATEGKDRGYTSALVGCVQDSRCGWVEWGGMMWGCNDPLGSDLVYLECIDAGPLHQALLVAHC